MSLADERRRPAQDAIDALRARGVHRLDPVRFRHIEALARRSAAHQGEARRLLDERLDRLLADCAQQAEARRAASAPRPGPARQRSALTDLLADLSRHGAEPSAGQGLAADAGHVDPGPQAPRELRTLRQHRSTWTRLKVDRQMVQAQARVPDNAGPLHTQRLLHQALTTMREISPDYVHRLMSHVEALLSLVPTGPAAPATKKAASRGSRER
jgi:hypothetical protein